MLRGSSAVFIALAIMLATAPAGIADTPREPGVPRLDPDYTSDVSDWWARHPMNPRAAGHLKVIESPEPVLTLRAGESIEAAVDRLPAAGGTLRLEPGVYDPFTIVGRSNVHILGPDEGEAIITGHSALVNSREAIDYSRFDQLVSHVDQLKYRDQNAWDLYRNPPRNFLLRNLVFDGFGRFEVNFPGVNIRGPGGALGLRGVRDAVVENCVFRNYLDTKVGLQHCGLVWGHYGLTNVWLRDCRFQGTARYAVYWDGAHGSGLIGCTIDGAGCKDGGTLFLTNHDFTDDRNENGRIDPDEEKCAKYLVFDGNTFEGDFSTPIRLTGQQCLVTANVASGRMLELVGVYQPGEVAHRNWKPGELRIRVTDNTVGTCSRALLNIFVLNEEKLKEVEQSPIDAQYTLERNSVASAPLPVRYTVQQPRKP